MTRLGRTGIAVVLLPVALLTLAALSAGIADAGAPAPLTPIRHFIVLLQENHSFDNYFGMYPGADGIPAGVSVPLDPAKGTTPAVRPYHIGNRSIVDLDHSGSAARIAVDGGRMDGFVKAQRLSGGNASLTMGHYDSSDLPFHWNVADSYVLFDRFFTSALGGSYLNHVYWIAASSGNTTGSVPPGGLRVATVFDRLQAQGISWKFYVQNYDPTITYRTLGGLNDPNRASQAVWCPLLTIPRFLDNAALNSRIVGLDQYYRDLRDGTLPAVAYIAPAGASEHPPGSLKSGQYFIRGLVNGLMTSSAWKSSAFMYSYDDWGGWYDHVMPPRRDRFGDGLRAPALLISPYARRHYIDHTTLDFPSIVKFIEDNWRLRPLGRLDATAGSIMGAFDFKAPARRATIMPFDRAAAPPVSRNVRDVVLYALYGTAVLAGAMLAGIALRLRLSRASPATEDSA